MQRRLRWTQVDEQEHSASPETPESGETAPATEPAAVTGPTGVTGSAPVVGPAPATGLMAVPGPEAVTGPAPGPGRERRGEGVRDVITSRGAGWAVAAAMAGAVVGLSVAMATSSSPRSWCSPTARPARAVPRPGRSAPWP